MFTLRVVGLDDAVARDKNGQRVGPLHAEATARTAFGLPTLIATCAYVSTCPIGICRMAFHTATWKGVPAIVKGISARTLADSESRR